MTEAEVERLCIYNFVGWLGYSPNGIVVRAASFRGSHLPAEKPGDEALLAHLDSVYRFALRLTQSNAHWAEDISQETMLRALAAPPALRSATGLKTWLYTVARNVWRDSLRREAVRRRVTSNEPIEQIRSRSTSAEHAAALQEEVELRLSDLDQLPDRQRSVLFLAACEGLDNRQIAAVLNISQQAVKASLSVARQRIRRCSTASPKRVNQHR